MSQWGSEKNINGALFVPHIASQTFMLDSSDRINDIICVHDGDNKPAADEFLLSLKKQFVGRPYLDWLASMPPVTDSRRNVISENQDKEIFEFTVLWEAWECDSKGWVMERPDGTRYLSTTSHGSEYEAKPEELHERIAEYERVLNETRQALELIMHDDK